MTTKDRLDLAKWAVTQARKHGADEAAVDISNSRDITVSFRDGKMDQLQESTQNSLTLALYTKNRYSGHTTNDVRRESLVAFIKQAVAMTQYLGEDPYRRLPDPKFYRDLSATDLHICDDAYETITADRLVALAGELEEVGRTYDPRVLSCTGECGDTHAESIKVNSNGFEGTRQSTIFYEYAEVTIDDGGGGRPEDYEYIQKRFHDKLPSPRGIATAAVERALKKIGRTKIASGSYDMVIENRTARRLLSAMMGPMSGQALQQRSSFLEGRQGQKIFSDKLTMIDDPFIPGGMGSRVYDSEGMAARKRTIIDKGVLNAYYIDCYYANKLGVEPTGGDSSNIILTYGTRDLAAMIGDMQRGILITEFLGGNANGTTGDFSYGIGGMLIEGGRPVKPINEMNISGNFLDLWQGLAEVGNDPYVDSSWRMPSLRFENVQFSGL